MTVSIEGAVRGARGLARCGCVFLDCGGFVKGCFSVAVGVSFAFEVVFIGFVIAIEKV